MTIKRLSNLLAAAMLYRRLLQLGVVKLASTVEMECGSFVGAIGG